MNNKIKIVATAAIAVGLLTGSIYLLTRKKYN